VKGIGLLLDAKEYGRIVMALFPSIERNVGRCARYSEGERAKKRDALALHLPVAAFGYLVPGNELNPARGGDWLRLANSNFEERV